MNEIKPIYCRPKDAEKIIGVNRGTIYRMMEKGLLKSIKIGGLRLILMSSIHDLAKNAGQ